jgi:hypothetical protein
MAKSQMKGNKEAKKPKADNGISTDATSRARLVPSFIPGAAPAMAHREPTRSFIANFLPSVRIIEILRIATVVAMGILMLIALRW